MKYFKSLLYVVLLGALVITTSAIAQDQALQRLIHGKKFFWEAKFDQALSSLRQVTEIEDAKREYLFEAYLYTGFVLLRQNASKSEIKSVFTEAINLDPKRKLDEMVIPPDLSEPFYEVREQMVGCVYVVSDPEEVDIVGVLGDSVLFDETTPILICDLVSSDYQLLLTEDGHEQQFIPLELTAGKTDTLNVTLKASYAQKGTKKGLKWIIRGSILVATGAVIYKTVLESKGEEGQTLPEPPVRPDVQ